MVVLLAAVPAHREPRAEDEVARHVKEHDQQEPPRLDLEVQVGLVLDVDPNQVERASEREQQDHRDALEDHEEEHGGHTTSGASR
jgi:hypothetical protein